MGEHRLRRVLREVVVASVAFLAMLFPAGHAAAYCRATTCEGDGKRCEPPASADCGTPIAWKRDCIGMAVQSKASAKVSYATAKTTLRQAFDAWEEADCSGGSPAIHVEILNEVECDAVEYNPAGTDHGNVNVLVFRDTDWPSEPRHNGVIALTTVNYDPQTGEIFDADIEVNTQHYEISTTLPVPSGEFDLLAVLTHEAGHVLGLAHSPVEGATMITSFTGDTEKYRSLEPDDVAGICAAYPPAEGKPASCNPIPRHGYSPRCGDAQTEGTCAVNAPGAPGAIGMGLPLLIGAALAAALGSRVSRPRGRRA